MRNTFQNKKVLISIIVAVIIIVVAIVLFVVLGKNGNKKSDGNSTIKFSEENKVTNKTLGGDDTNTSKTGNNTSSDLDVGSDVEDFQKEAAEQFVKAFMDEDEMNDFLENYVDIKAYVAYENVDGDETKFWDEYESIADDDSTVEETKQTFSVIPSGYKEMLTFIDMANQMAEQYKEMSNQTGNSVDSNTITTNTVDFDNITDEDKKLVLKAIKNPEKSESDENITRVTITCSWMQQDVDLDMVFYGDVVIFICDEEGTSLTKSVLNQGSGMSGFDEEN